MNELPDKPSELLRLALSDLAKVEASPDYVVDMARFHEPFEGACRVCLAGAVMAGALRADPKKHVPTHNYDINISRKLYALDEFRCGKVSGAFDELGQRYENAPDDFCATKYKHDPEKWRGEMNKLADDLEAAGL